MLGVLGPEPAEVDDALDAGIRGSLGEVDRRLAILGREVAARAHRVHQVIGGLGALERFGEAGAGEHVTLACITAARPAAAE
jgi:hypothetical protein